MLMLSSAFCDNLSFPNENCFLSSNLDLTVNYPPLIHSKGQLGKSMISTIFKNDFKSSGYPNRASLNPFCPFCLKYVSKNCRFFSTFQQCFQKYYLCHENCLSKETNNCLNTLLEEVSQAQIVQANETDKMKMFALGNMQYYVQLQLAHSLTSKRYFKLENKLMSTYDSKLIWDFRSPTQEASYFPNIIAFPYPDFELTFSWAKIVDCSSKTTSKAFVNLQKIRSEGDREITIKTEDFDILAKIITKTENKKDLIESMNFKYKHPSDIDFPLVQILKISLNLQQQEAQSYICGDQNSSITELLNETTSNYSEFSYSNNYYNDSPISKHSDVLSERSVEKQTINLEWLVKSNQLGEFVRDSVQSRNFQLFIGDAYQQEIELIVNALKDQFADLATHEYGNYMMQKLFVRCNFHQRFIILRQLIPYLPGISISTQGTHTLQSFVPLITQEDQINLLVQGIQPHFIALTPTPNATHLIQKIITFLPINATINLFNIAAQQFINFSTNKNSICVLKQMFKKMRQSQTTKLIPSKVLSDLKRFFLTPLLMNLDRVIQDTYGNYVVQFLFQNFGERQCGGITQLIIDRFRQYSIHKYAGNVVLRCVDSYWDQRQVSDRLKTSLTNKTILDLYFCKEGNRILLSIMEKYHGTNLQQKISSQLMTTCPTKFSHDRWNLLLGCRSSTAVTYSSFTDAVRCKAVKKKKHYDIIQ